MNAHQKRGHTRISPSMLYRIWEPGTNERKCIGSVALSQFAPPAKTSEAAQDGTKTHELYEQVLSRVLTLQRTHAKEETAEALTLVNQYKTKEKDADDYDIESRTERVAWSVFKALRALQEIIAEQGGTLNNVVDLHIEGYSKRLKDAEWTKVSPTGRLTILEDSIEKIEGHVDFAACFVIDNTPHLFISDLKDGRKYQSPIENPQLIAYANGYRNQMQSQLGLEFSPISTVSMQIVQPRLSTSDYYRIAFSQLAFHADRLLSIANEAQQIAKATTSAKSKELHKFLKYDQNGCYFCPARLICSEYQQTTQAKQVVSFIDGVGSELSPPLRKALTDEQLEKLVVHKKELIKFIEAIEDYILDKKQAAPETFPLLSVTKKQTKRRWAVSTEQVINTLEAAGLSKTSVVRESLETQTNIKKALKALKTLSSQDVDSLLESLTEKPKGSPTLTPVKTISID